MSQMMFNSRQEFYRYLTDWGAEKLKPGGFSSSGSWTKSITMANNIVNLGLTEDDAYAIDAPPALAYVYSTHTTLIKNMQMSRAKHRPYPKLYVFWGDSGTGKSRSAIHMFPNAYLKSASSGKWFDGYISGSPIIMDEFDATWFPMRDLLVYLDGGPPLRTESKGSMLLLNPPVIVLTSNIDPASWYTTGDTSIGIGAETLRAFWRRFASGGIYHFKQHTIDSVLNKKQVVVTRQSLPGRQRDGVDAHVDVHGIVQQLQVLMESPPPPPLLEQIDDDDHDASSLARLNQSDSETDSGPPQRTRSTMRGDTDADSLHPKRARLC